MKDVDREMMAMLDEAAVGYRLVLTKADKIKAERAGSGASGKPTAEARKHAAAHPDDASRPPRSMGMGDRAQLTRDGWSLDSLTIAGLRGSR